MSAAKRYTRQQVLCMAILEQCAPAGVDLSTLARIMQVSESSADRTASSLVRRGKVEAWLGGVGIERTHYSKVMPCTHARS